MVQSEGKTKDFQERQNAWCGEAGLGSLAMQNSLGETEMLGVFGSFWIPDLSVF